MSDEAMKIPAFVRYWTASTTGSFGTAVSTVAVQVLVVQVLVATPAEVGVVNAARVLPYAFLGLFAGVLVDRVRRWRSRCSGWPTPFRRPSWLP